MSIETPQTHDTIDVFEIGDKAVPSTFADIVHGRRRDDLKPTNRTAWSNFRLRRTAKHVSRRSEMGTLALAWDRLSAFGAGVMAAGLTVASFALMAAAVSLGAVRS